MPKKKKKIESSYHNERLIMKSNEKKEKEIEEISIEFFILIVEYH